MAKFETDKTEKTQRRLFSAESSEPAADPPALNTGLAAAAAWNEVKDIFSQMSSDPTNNPVDVNSEFCRKLIEACRIEEPQFEIKEILDYLCRNVDRPERAQALSDGYVLNMYYCISKKNLHPEYTAASDIKVVQSTVFGLETLRSVLGDQLVARGAAGRKLLERIEKDIRAGKDYLNED